MSHEGHYRSLRSRETGDKELGLFLSKRTHVKPGNPLK